LTEEPSQPLVSVILPCYKTGQFIGEALESVGAQTYRNWEVIAVDDCGPEDGTREAVEAFAAKFPNHRILYHRHEKNAGVSAARNTGIRAARGDVVALLDSDDLWNPDHLGVHISILCQNSDVVLSYSQADTIDERGDLLTEPTGFYNFCGVAGNGIPGRMEDGYFRAMMVWIYVPVSTACLRRDVLLEIGGFQEGMKYQIEDWVMWARAGKRGAIHFTERSSARYRIHPQSFSNRQSVAGAIDNHIEFVFTVGDHEGRSHTLSRAMARITTRALNYPRGSSVLRMKFAAKILLQCFWRGWWRQAMAAAEAWGKFLFPSEIEKSSA
jgi:glycosyltransferase involved in cell wall biosynthesis